MNLFKTVKSLKETTSLSWEEIAAKVKHVRDFKSGEALRSWYKRERSRERHNRSIEVPQTAIPESKPSSKVYTDNRVPVSLAKPFDDILSLNLAKNESALIVADIHVPYHHESFILDMVSSVSKNYNLKYIVIAGDLFTFDQISKYSKAHNMPRMETELEIGGSVLMYFAQHAPVYITNSNHDSRFANKIDVQFSLKRLMHAALNGRNPINPIITTERDYIFVNDDFIIGHLNNASSFAGKIAHNIAQKYQRHCLAGHDHIVGVFNPRSRYIGASIGCSADFEKFWYAEKGMNPTKFMQRGYAVITGNSTIELYNEKIRYFHRWQDDVTYSTCVTDHIAT